MDDSPTTPSRHLRAYAVVAKGALWVLLAAWLLLVLAWGALHAFIVPRIGELRPQLELQASRTIGVPVRIGSIEARSEGLIPSFELHDVVLLGPDGRAALRLPRVLVALSPRSVWKMGFEQLYIDRPELDVRRARDGRVYVAGLDFSRVGDDGTRARDWFFSQPEFVIEGGTIRWTDEQRGAEPLALAQVDFVVRNSGRRHAIRLDATPPPQWGNRFTLRGLFRQPLLSRGDGRWREWQGQVHGDFSRVDLSQLRRYADFGVQIREGRGALRAWADVERGQLAGGTADVMLADVSATLADKLEPLALRSISGRIGGRRLPAGFEFETQALQFETQDGERWPGGNLFVHWEDTQGSREAHGELRADRLELRALSRIASRLPLGTATHQALAGYAPAGLVERVQAKWEGPADALHKYEARGRVTGLEIAARAAQAASGTHAAHGATPGVRGAAVDFELTQSGGRGKLAIQRGALDLPGVFEEPLVPLDEFSADVQWKLDGPSISAAFSNLRFANADAQGEGNLQWRTAAGPQRFPGVLDLTATVSRADGTRVWRYLPLGVPKTTRDYVREAVQQGRASGARFRVKGDLHDFPFADAKKGEFRVSAEVRDATFAYVPRSVTKTAPPWPALVQVAGELVFERNGMRVNAATGRFAGAPGLQFKADAQIPELGRSVVLVNSEIKGPLNEALAIVNTSALSPLINQSLAHASASGAAEVKLKLELPLAAMDRAKVQGALTLAGNDLQITPDTPALGKARGAVTFSERGFQVVNGQARALGGDVKFEGGTRALAANASRGSPEPGILLRAQGTLTAEGLRQARELGAIARLARDASGSTPYAVSIAIRRGVPEVALTSTLQGLALNLPPPLNKPAETALPLRFENALLREALVPGARLQDQLTLELGRLGSVAYVRDLGEGEPRALRGAIAVGLALGESVPMPEQGVAANINLVTVNLDAWENLFRASGAPAAAGGAQRAASQDAASSYLPTAIAMRARELVWDGRSLHDVVVGGSREGSTWRANVDGDELNGYVEYRQGSPSGAARLFARLARLSIAASAATQVESLIDEQTASLPALDIVVDDFDLKGKKLGKLEIDAVNRSAGAREWRLNKLNLTVPEAAFTASGNWAAVNAQAATPRAGSRTGERMRTAMRFRLDIADSGQLLARFGMKDVLRRGKGRMEGQVAWLGSPLSLNYGTMDGVFNVNVESGQFLKADPGLAKLLGVLSLQTLPRRLALDFRDVFSEGFPFDFVRGDVTIQDGIAATNNLQMKGVNAAVLMEGKADIARETQDLRVVVVPEINAGTASLVATVINPALGLGSFLAQVVLRQPLIRAATQEFHVDGTWSDPQVTRVRRSETRESSEAQAAPAKPSSTTN